MKEKMLSGDLKNLKKCRTLAAIFLVFVMVIALMCAVACTGDGGESVDSSASASDGFDPDDSEDSGDVEDSSGIEDAKIVLKEIPDAGNVKLVDDAIRKYLSASAVSEQIAALPQVKVQKDYGALPVKLAWNGNGSVRYTIYIADNENFDNAMSYVVSGFTKELDIYNLLPATTYYWKVEGDRSDMSDTSVFKTEDLSVRLIYAEGTSNIRDLGGWNADGSFVNYGKIYRGNQLNGYGNWGDNKLTENGLKTFKDDLKIKTEIDLRTQDKDDANQTVNFVDASLPYYKYTIGQYTDILEPSVWNALPHDGNTSAESTENKNDARRLSYATGNAVRNENAMRRSLKSIFEVLADERNYPVYIHCNAGADRTGTVAFLINGLLGVSEADLIRDYELTSFSKVSGLRYRSEIKNGDFTEIGVMKNDYDNFVAFGALMNAIKNNYGAEGGTLSYAIENFLTDYVGVSHEDIESLKRIMISDYTPVETEYVVGDRQVVEAAKTTNTLNLGDVEYSSVESIYINNVSLGNSLSAIDGSKFANVYGERELTVVVNSEKGKKIIKVPVFVVTKYIYTAEDLISALKITAERNYGYYELKNNITLGSFANEAKASFSGRNGFCGILEGNGYTITAPLGNHGLFGYVIAGATIRNVNFAVSGGVNEAGKSVIGDYVLNSFIENVTISVSEGVPGIGVDGIGLVTTKSFKGNSVKKLSVYAENAKLDSLFGFDKQYTFGGNDFTSCLIKAKHVKELARQYTDGTFVPVYLEDTYGFDGEITDAVEMTVADVINVKGSVIELNIGGRFINSTINHIECNNVSIKEYKYKNGVLYLYNDELIFGENLGKTTISIDFKSVNGILVHAKISAVAFTNSEKVVFDEVREIYLNRNENSLDLGRFGGATVYSISCNGFFFGSDVNALDISDEVINNKALHGNNLLTVLLEKDGKFYTVTIPVTLVTAEINSAEQLNELLKSDNAEYAIYGYYKLTTDIGKPETAFNNGTDNNWQNVDGLYGFRGTLDGAGHSITGTVFTRGLLGLVGKGAVIKNFTVNAYGFANGRTVLARSIRDAVVENVVINIKSGESDSYLTEGGIITAIMSHSTIYRNVEINSDGKTDTLFGCSFWNYDPRKANVFENVKVTVKSIGGLLCLRANIAESLYTIDGVEGLTVEYVRSYDDENNTALVGGSAEFTLGDENADVTEINSVTFDGREIKGFTFENGILAITENFTVSDIGAKTFVLKGKVGDKAVTVYLGATIMLPGEEVLLEGDREIVLSNGTEFALDLGEYADSTVLAATLGSENVTYANGKLIVTGEYKANKQKHGMQTLKVTVEKGGKYYIVTVKVLVVTKAISTIDELTAAMTAGTDNVVYGYYRLTQNVGASEAWISVENKGDWKNADGSVGFRGTLDGNGFAVDGAFGTHSLFGIIGNGAVVKNITFNVYYYQNNRQTLARSITGATIEGVTINIKSIHGILDATKEGGVITGLMSHTTHYKDVTINAEGKDIDTLFGKSYGNYKAEKANTFENCVVNAKSLAGLVHSNEIISAVGIDGLAIMLTPDTITAEEKLEIGTEYIMSIATVAEITKVTLDENDFSAYSFEAGMFTIFADAFGVSDSGVKTFVITGKNAGGYTVKQTVIVTVELKATEVALEGDREIVLSNGTEFALDLGAYADSTVLSATLGGENATYANGKLIVTEEYKANKQKHGLQTLKVTVEKSGKYYVLTANVLVVTKAISTINELNTALKGEGDEYAIYGYYKLVADLGAANYDGIQNGSSSKNWANANGEYGFRGTFDGNDKSISAIIYNFGIFGIVGKGAYIKNLTVNSYKYSNGRTILARTITEATIENVTINVISGSSDSYYAEGGVITALLSHSSKYINVKIKSSSDLDTLFGFSYWNYNPAKSNTFENCTVEAKSIGGIICITTKANMAEPIVSIAGVKGLNVTLNKDAVAADNMTVGQAAVIELPDLTEITSIVLDNEEFTAYSFENGVLTINADAFTAFQIGVKKFGVTAKNKQGLTVVFEITMTVELVADPVTLEGNREIVLSDASDYAVDLGEYAASTVISSTFAGENATFADGKLTITDALKANKQKHGMQTLKVTVLKDGKYYVVTANVLVVTKAISTINELTAALTAGTDNVVYGYYRLTQNVGSSEAWINVANNGSWQNVDGSVGFRGTLDGNGFAVDGAFGTHSLFGIIGNGAVVKNITFNVYYYQNNRQTLARSITGATIEGVTINIKSIHGILDATKEGGVITGLMSHTTHYKDVTINAEGKDIDTLFGKSYGNYKAEKANTFENCVVNAKSLAGLVHSNEIISAAGIDGLTIKES